MQRRRLYDGPSIVFVVFIITHMFWFGKGYLWDFAQIAVKFQAIDIFLTFFAIFRQCSTLYDISHTFHHFLRFAAQRSLRNGAVFFLCKLPLPARFPVKIHRRRTGSVFSFQVVCIVTLRAGLCKGLLRGQQCKGCAAIRKEASLRAVHADRLRNKRRRTLAAGLVDALAETVIGRIHLAQASQNLRRAGVKMLGDELL